MKLNTVHLLLYKQKTPQKRKEIKKSSRNKTINFIMSNDGIPAINQVLKTVLKLMNEIPVEEEVSWENIHQLQQNYIILTNQ